MGTKTQSIAAKAYNAVNTLVINKLGHFHELI